MSLISMINCILVPENIDLVFFHYKDDLASVVNQK